MLKDNWRSASSVFFAAVDVAYQLKESADDQCPSAQNRGNRSIDVNTMIPCGYWFFRSGFPLCPATLNCWQHSKSTARHDANYIRSPLFTFSGVSLAIVHCKGKPFMKWSTPKCLAEDALSLQKRDYTEPPGRIQRRLRPGPGVPGVILNLSSTCTASTHW